MSNELIFVLVFFWVTSAAYVMYYHNKNWTLGLDIIIGAILLGPILALIVGDDVKRIEKHYKQKEKESNNKHGGWFRTMSEINRQRMTSFGRTIPPPPPISRIAQVQSERETAIRSAIERIEPPNRRPNKITKDFKFFQK
jgi:hypothetical protein